MKLKLTNRERITLAKNITVLADEKLGGIEREYIAVSRIAQVGEKIVTTEEGWIYRTIPIGTVLDVEHVFKDGSVSTPAVNYESYEYKVLVPSRIIHVNGERFRMVNREARVGDTIVITNWSDDHSVPNAYKNGDIAVVGKGTFDPSHIRIDRPDLKHGFVALWYDEFAIIERIEDELSSRPPYEQAAETIANLTSTVTALTGEVEALKMRLVTLESVGHAVRCAELVQELGDALRSALGQYKPSDLSLNKDELQRAADAFKTDQQIRDEIVERAKEDVKDLISRNYPEIDPTVWFAKEQGVIVTDRCDFVVTAKRKP